CTQLNSLRFPREGGMQNSRIRIEIAKAGEVTLGYPHAGKIMRVGKPRTLDDQTVYRSAQRILSAGEKHEAELQVFAVHAVDTLTHALLKLASGYFMR